MISVSEAARLVLNTAKSAKITKVALENALGCVLAEPFIADRDFPPFNRATMDGIAIDVNITGENKRSFNVAGIQAAGTPPLTGSAPNSCIEIMTGAVVPEGFNTVVRYEDLDFSVSDQANVATIRQDVEVKTGQNIHSKGKDCLKNDVLVSPPCVLSPAELAIAATIGKTQIAVYEFPSVAIVGTGDELVDVDKTPELYQIRSSNVYALQALIQQAGGQSVIFKVSDDLEPLLNALQEIVNIFNLVIITGGVSKGKFDHIPGVLERAGIEKKFHGVAQRPGKPFWFGTSESCAVFALPGNPVSAFAGACRYILPWLKKSMGLPFSELICARLEEDVEFKPILTLFMQVKTRVDVYGVIWAKPVRGNNSGDFIILHQADAFIELPPEKEKFEKGETFPVIYFRNRV